MWRILPKYVLEFERSQVSEEFPPIKSPTIKDVLAYKRKLKEENVEKRPASVDKVTYAQNTSGDEPPYVEAEIEEDPAEENENSSDSEGTDEEWEIETILDMRKDEDGVLEYLVHWRDYPEDEATWEPKENLAGAAQEIENFHRKNPRRRPKMVKKADKERDLAGILVDDKENSDPEDLERDPSPDFLDDFPDEHFPMNDSDSSDEDFEPGVSEPMKKKQKKEHKPHSSPLKLTIPALPHHQTLPNADRYKPFRPKIMTNTRPLGSQFYVIPSAALGMAISVINRTKRILSIPPAARRNFFIANSSWKIFNPTPTKLIDKMILKITENLFIPFSSILNPEHALAYLIQKTNKDNRNKLFNSSTIEVIISNPTPPPPPAAPIDLTDDEEVDAAKSPPMVTPIRARNVSGQTITGLQLKSIHNPETNKNNVVYVKPDGTKLTPEELDSKVYSRLTVLPSIETPCPRMELFPLPISKKRKKSSPVGTSARMVIEDVAKSPIPLPIDLSKKTIKPKEELEKSPEHQDHPKTVENFGEVVKEAAEVEATSITGNSELEASTELEEPQKSPLNLSSKDEASKSEDVASCPPKSSKPEKPSADDAMRKSEDDSSSEVSSPPRKRPLTEAELFDYDTSELPQSHVSSLPIPPKIEESTNIAATPAAPPLSSPEKSSLMPTRCARKRTLYSSPEKPHGLPVAAIKPTQKVNIGMALTIFRF